MKASFHPSSEFVRLLLMGPSGAGKSGALLSLILAGYKVRVIDMDNGLDWLVNFLKKHHPDKLDNLDYMTFKDKYKMTAGGPMPAGVPNAYTRAIQALQKWDDGSNPQEWGPEYILALDSLTFFGSAAHAWQDMLTPPGKSGQKDGRAIYGNAQGAVSDVLDAITSPDFKTNVIVNTHVRWTRVTDEKGNVTIVKGGPSSIGEALTDRIGTYFNSVGLFESSGTGASVKRSIKFQSTGLIDLKASIEIPGSFPIETGLATFFKTAKGG